MHYLKQENPILGGQICAFSIFFRLINADIARDNHLVNEGEEEDFPQPEIGLEQFEESKK